MRETKLYRVETEVFHTPNNGYIPGLAYEVFVPKKCDYKKENLPMIVFLHGAGERGDKFEDLDRVNSIGFPSALVNDVMDVPAIVLCPQCPDRMIWTNLIFTVKELIDKVAAEYNVDPHRITATGLSMGGYGTWELGVTYPALFAGIAPICGGGMPWRAINLFETPVWAFHGDFDDCVPIHLSTDMVDAVNRIGGKADLTIFHGVGHDSWDHAYWFTTLVNWLLEKKRENLTFSIQDQMH